MISYAECVELLASLLFGTGAFALGLLPMLLQRWGNPPPSLLDHLALEVAVACSRSAIRSTPRPQEAAESLSGLSWRGGLLCGLVTSPRDLPRLPRVALGRFCRFISERRDRAALRPRLAPRPPSVRFLPRCACVRAARSGLRVPRHSCRAGAVSASRRWCQQNGGRLGCFPLLSDERQYLAQELCSARVHCLVLADPAGVTKWGALNEYWRGAEEPEDVLLAAYRLRAE